MNHTIKDEMYICIAKELGCEVTSITDEDGWNITNGWDSIIHISIITNIEKVFDITIPDEEISNLTTVGKIMGYVRELIDRRNKSESIYGKKS